MDNEHGHFGSKTGLFDFRANDDIGVFLGCGLGGTSLVNAGVVLPAEPRVLADPVWPQALRDDADGMRDGYERASEMLKPGSYPDDFPPLEKLAALEAAGDHLGERFYRPPINVNYKPDGVNHVGVYQRACRLCGDCVSGCNYAAKNTLIMNYLPDARNHGAEIYTQLKVGHVERGDGRWLVHFEPIDSGREAFDAPKLFVSADIVVLGAGALGSTEILLRSAGERGLRALGPPRHALQRQRRLARLRLQHRPAGQRHRLRRPRREGARRLSARASPASSTSASRATCGQGLVIEEGVIPGALSVVLAQLFAAAAAIVGNDTDEGVHDFFQERRRELESLFGGAYGGRMRNTHTYLVMTHDDSSGQMVLQGRPGAGRSGRASARSRSSRRSASLLEQATTGLGGNYVKNPIWSSSSATTWSPSTRSAAARWARTPRAVSSTTRAVSSRARQVRTSTRGCT